MAEVLRKLNLCHSGWNYRSIRARAEALGLFVPPGRPKRPKGKGSRIPDEEVFVANSTYSNSALRRRIVRNQLVDYKCAICGINRWQGSAIALQLDHCNGDRHDHRLDNLRFLCPNCHSQTETWGRKRHGRKCKGCDKNISARAEMCKGCFAKARLGSVTKIDWPSYDVLQRMVECLGFNATGRKLGVSDNAVRKRLRKHGVKEKL